MLKICPLKMQRGITEGVPAMCLAQVCCCLFLTLGSKDSKKEEARDLSKYNYLSYNLFDLDIITWGCNQTHTFVSAEGWHFVIPSSSSTWLHK